MTRDQDGQLKLSMPVLIAIISAALAVGSGGAWITGATARAPSAPSAVPSVVAEASAAEVKAINSAVEEHRRIDEARDAVAASKVASVEARLDRIEDGINRLLARSARSTP